MNLESIISHVKDLGADYCDIRKETWESTVLNVRDGILEQVTHGGEEGAMVRVLYQKGWGHVGTALPTVKDAAEKALSVAKSISAYKKEKTELAPVEIHQEKTIMPMGTNFNDVSPEEKITFLQELNTRLNKDFVTSTELVYMDSLVKKEIVTSEGTCVTMEIPRLMVYMTITGKGDTVQRAAESTGGTGGYELTEAAYTKTDIVLERLHSLLNAKTPPSGSMPLVMDPNLTGVFIHEAFGHAAEGDTVVSKSSCLENKLGDTVAAPDVTITDDPTIQGYGQFPFDDEGTRARPRVLVKDGVLTEYILDRESAGKLKLESNGGARAEDFRVPPLVRMSNTLMESGDLTFEELLEQVNTGVYAESSSGGQVSPPQGTFQFNAQIAFLIENGEIQTPLRDVSFSGFTLQTLQHITGITRERGEALGHCGKGQRATVSMVGPHILVSDVMVGGRA
jgi:TldD protein